jgi:hypothetical protein
MVLLRDVRIRSAGINFVAITAPTGEGTHQNFLSKPCLLTVLYNVSSAPESPILQRVGRWKRLSVPGSGGDLPARFTPHRDQTADVFESSDGLPHVTTEETVSTTVTIP